MQVESQLAQLSRIAGALLLAVGSSGAAKAAPEPTPAAPVPGDASPPPSSEILHLRDPEEIRRELRPYWPLIRALPLDDLEEVVLERGSAELVFDFGERKSRKITLPPKRVLVLESRDRRDPLRVGPRNRVVRGRLDGQKLLVRSRLKLFFGEQGLRGIRSGDLKVQRFFVSWEMEVRQEHHPDRIDRDSRDRPILELDERGRPLVREGHYVPIRFDEWIVIECHGHRFQIGLPPETLDPPGEPRLCTLSTGR